MKKTITIFSRDTYASRSDGTAERYVHDPKLCGVLGQADIIRLHFIGHRMSSATARVVVSAWESAWPGRRPAEAQQKLGMSLQVMELRPGMFDIYGPFSGMVELTLDVDDSASSSDQQFECELNATIINGD